MVKKNQLKISNISKILKMAKSTFEDLFYGGVYELEASLDKNELPQYVEGLKKRVEKLNSDSKKFNSKHGRRITNKFLEDFGYGIEPDTKEYDLFHRKTKKMLSEITDKHIQMILGEIDDLYSYYEKIECNENQKDANNGKEENYLWASKDKDVKELNELIRQIIPIINNSETLKIIKKDKKEQFNRILEKVQKNTK
jgi:hypothetical protein